MKIVKSKKHHYILWTIRILLIVSASINLIRIVLLFTDSGFTSESEVMADVSEKAELIFWALLTLAITYLLDYFENKNIHIPVILESIVTIYIFAAIFLTTSLDLFTRYVWWDMFLHTFSGMLLAFIGFLGIYKINRSRSMDLSSFLAAAFAFGFSISLSVLFEIYEFFLDVVFGTRHQSWGYTNPVFELGNDYQGSGLRDTMTDLICDTVGAFIISLLFYFLYKHEKKKTLEMMNEIFPEEEVLVPIEASYSEKQKAENPEL
ncbi:MAG: hypothetical protein PHW27_11240 [Melioribacteraceae bacterium]|nr:hypothetical protein [Melioribacteraceae bacterium]MDD3559130.1 hypothetical protein [Melioribacteraceae bacterium]